MNRRNFMKALTAAAAVPLSNKVTENKVTENKVTKSPSERSEETQRITLTNTDPGDYILLKHDGTVEPRLS